MSLSNEVKKLLQDSNTIWEALSADGVTYPFNDSRFGKSEKTRFEIVEEVNAFDKERALSIANLILLHEEEIENGNTENAIALDTCIGAIVRNQVIGHMKRIEEFGQ